MRPTAKRPPELVSCCRFTGERSSPCPGVIGIVDRVTVLRDAHAQTLRAAGYEPLAVDRRTGAPRGLRAAHAVAVVVGVHDEEDVQTVAELHAGRNPLPLLAVLTSVAGGTLQQLIDAGATGVISLEAAPVTMMCALSAVLAGLHVRPSQCYGAPPPAGVVGGLLTGDEQRWLRGLAHGATVAELADDACYSERSMYRRLRHIYHRLGATDRASAITEALHRELI